MKINRRPKQVKVTYDHTYYKIKMRTRLMTSFISKTQSLLFKLLMILKNIFGILSRNVLYQDHYMLNQSLAYLFFCLHDRHRYSVHSIG